MTGIFVGNGLGLFQSSLTELGLSLGSSNLGQANLGNQVNVHNGNLVLTQQDSILIGRGVNANLVRTYNSQGNFDDDNGDNWSLSISSIEKSSDGSFVHRTTSSGTKVMYRWDSVRELYQSTEGRGAHDTIKQLDNGSFEWHQDDSSGLIEVYESNGRLISQRDRTGNKTTYAYTSSGFIDQISTSEQSIKFHYQNNQVTHVQIETYRSNTTAESLTSTVARYEYDDKGRLYKTILDLTPEDNDISDGNVYETLYEYYDGATDNGRGASDGGGDRIKSIAQSDGSQISFTYQLHEGVYKVRTVEYGNGEQITYTYGLNSTHGNYTQVSNQLGQSWFYFHNDKGQLTRFETPQVEGQRIATKYQYDDDDNLIRVVDGDGYSTTYDYDERGNRQLELNSVGSTIERTFNSNNQILTETRFVVVDPDGDGSGQPGQPLTSRFIYNDMGQLLFSLNGEGEVTAFQYDANGFVKRKTAFSGDSFDVSMLSHDQTISLEQMNQWVASADKLASQPTEYVYDFRGQLLKKIAYSLVDGSGLGIGTPSVTSLIYDYKGRLLETITPRGVATNDQEDYRTQFHYDGLGRLLGSTDAYGNTTTNQYLDSDQKIVTLSANGLYTTSVYDAAGRTVNVSQSNSLTDDDNLGFTQYFYNSVGQLRATRSADGAFHYRFYDNLGRVNAEVDGSGSVTGFLYNKNNQVVKTIIYATDVDTSNWINSESGQMLISNVADVLPESHYDDRIITNQYDTSGRLSQTTDPKGTVTTFTYDGANRLIKTQVGNRVTRVSYDKAGRVIYQLDARNGLIENVYDEAGRLVKTIAYARTVFINPNETIENLSPVPSPADQITYFFYNAQGQLSAELNAEGYLTEMFYDLDGNLIRQKSYFNSISYLGDGHHYLRPKLTSLDRWNQYQYDELGRLIEETNHEGTSTRYTYDDVGNLIKTEVGEDYAQRRNYLAYDELGRLTHTVNGEGSSRLGANASEQDVKQQSESYGTRYLYDSAGRKVKSIDANGNAMVYYYDLDGNVTLSVDAEGGVTQTIYNAFGELAASIQYTNTLSNVATLTGGDLNATIISMIESIADTAKDTKTEFKYNQRGQIRQILNQVLNPQGELDWVSTSHEYNLYGDKTSTTEQLDFLGQTRTTHFNYDIGGYLTSVYKQKDTAEEQKSFIGHDVFGRLYYSSDDRGLVFFNIYDRLGRLIEVVDPSGDRTQTTYDAFDQVLSQTDELGQVTRYAYDDVTKSMTITSPDGSEVKTIHNEHGETVEVIDGNGNSTTFFYDLNGNVSLQRDAIGNMAFSAHDQTGLLLWNVDKRGIQTSYRYDAVGRLLTQTLDPGGLNLSSSYAYDGKGQVITQTDARGVVTKTRYDKRGQVKELIKDAGGLNLRTLFEYNAVGNQIRIVRAAGSSSEQVTEYVYDKLSRRIQTVQDPGGLAIATEYQYDKLDNVIRSIDGKGNVTAFEYDNKNQLIKTIEDFGGLNIETRVDYDAIGQVTSQFDANGIETRFEYASDGMLIKQINDFGGLNQSVRYEYDNNNNRIRTIDSKGVTTRFDYDQLNRVIRTVKDEGGLNISFTSEYDSVGNVVRVRDGNGNLTHYAYDSANRLVYSVNANRYLTQNIYDDNSNLIERREYQQTIQERNSWSHQQLDTLVLGGGVDNIYEDFDDLNSFLFDFSQVGANSENTIVHENGALVFANKYGEEEQRHSVSRRFGRQLSDNYTTRFEFKVDNNSQATDFKAILGNDNDSFFHGIHITQDSDFIIGDDSNATEPKNDKLLVAKIVSSNNEISPISPSLVIAENTNYIVEFETSANGTTLYFYREDQGRDSAFIHELASIGNVGEVSFTASTRISPKAIAINPGTVYLDNFSEQGQGLTYINQKFSYDALSRNSSSTDFEGFVTEKNYDVLGQLIKLERFDNQGHSVSTEYVYDALGRVVFSKNPEGYISENIYDANSNVIKVIHYGEFSSENLNIEGSFSKNFNTADNIDAWTIYDNDPPGASITKIYDQEKGSIVTQLQGMGGGNAYALYNETVGQHFTESKLTDISWDMKFSQGFTFYIRLQTTGGSKTIAYRPGDREAYSTGGYLWYSLGTDVTDGSWKSFNRNLQADISALQPGVEILKLESVAVRGSGLIGNVSLTQDEASIRDSYQNYIASDPILNSIEHSSATHYFYDGLNRLQFTVNAENYVTENIYDDLGQLIEIKKYEQPIELSTTEWTESGIRTALSRYFNEDFSGDAVSNFYMGDVDNDHYHNMVTLAEGRLAFQNVHFTSTRTAKVYTHQTIDMDRTTTIKFDLATGNSNIGQNFFIGLDNIEVFNNQFDKRRLQHLLFEEGKIFVRSHSEGETTTRKEFLMDAETNTDYKVEINVKDGKSTLIIYKNGESKSSGKIHQIEVNANEWSSGTRLRAYSPSARHISNAESPIYLDNIEVNTSAPSISTHYVYDNLGRQTYLVDGEGFVTQNLYDLNGNIIENRRYEKQINGDAVVTEYDIQRELNTNYYQTFDRDFSGISYPDSELSDLVYFQDGQAVFERGVHPTSVWPNIYRDLSSYEADKGFRAEVSTKEIGTEFLYMTIDNSKTFGTEEFRRHGVHFYNGTILVHTQKDGENGSVNLGKSKENTTYAIEFETHSDKTIVYIYEKGKARSEGYEHIFEAGNWGDIRMGISTHGGPNDPRGVPIFLDNVSEYKVNDELPNYQSTRFTYDLINRNVSTLDALGFEEFYEYDANGNRISMTNKKGDTWNYVYDKNNQLLKEISPEALHYFQSDSGPNLSSMSIRLEKSFSYNFNGDVIAITDAANTDYSRTTRYDYNNMGQQTHIYYPRVDGENGLSETLYDAYGNAVVNKDIAGHYSYKTYNKNQKLEFEIDALGYVTHYEHDAFGNTVKLTRYSNAVNTSTLDGNIVNSNQVEQILQIDSNHDRVITIEYDKINRQTRTYQSMENSYFIGEDVGGRLYNDRPETRYEYDAFGNLTKQSIKKNQSQWTDTYFYYDDNNQKIASVNGERFLSTSQYDAYGNLLKTVEYARRIEDSVDLAYLPNAPLAGDNEIGHNRVKHFEYDNLNQQVKVSHGTDTQRIMSETTYDALGNTLTTKDAYGQSTLNTYDALGRTSKVTTSERDVANSYVNAFNSSGRLSVTPTIEFKLDVHGNTLEEIQKSGQLSFAANRVKRFFYDEQGRLTKEIGPTRHEVFYKYDRFGRVIESTQQVSEQYSGWNNGNYSYHKKEQYQYDAVGQQIATITSATISGDATKSIVRKSTFNAFGEQINASVKDESSQEYELASYQYDRNGNIVSSSERGIDSIYSFNLQGKVTKKTVEGVRSTVNQYNAVGQTIRQQLPTFTGSLTSNVLKRPLIEQRMDAWGNILELREKRDGLDSDFAITRYQFNDMNNVVLKIEPEVEYMNHLGLDRDENDNLLTITPTTQYEYNQAGDLIRVIDAKNNSQVRKYDSSGNVIEEIDALNNSTYHAYNGYGEKVATKNAVGIINYEKYNQFGSVAESGLVRNGQEVTLKNFEYDSVGNRTKITRRFGDGTSAIEFTQYDQNGKVTKTRGSGGIEVHYQYDLLGNKVYEADGNSRQSDARFYAKTWNYSVETGQLLTSSDLEGRVKYYAYDEFSQVTRSEITGLGGQEEWREYFYYDNGLLKRIHHKHEALATMISTAADEESNFEYDIVGNRTKEKHIILRTSSYVIGSTSGDSAFNISREVDYTFDALNRLVSMSSPQADDTWETVNSSIYPSRNDRTSGIQSLTYKYDENGNRRFVHTEYFKRNTNNLVFASDYYDYDEMNRLTVSNGVRRADGIDININQGVRLTYDALGRRKTATSIEEINAHYGSRFIEHNGVTSRRKIRGDKFKTELYSFNDQNQMDEIKAKTIWEDLEYEVVVGEEDDDNPPQEIIPNEATNLAKDLDGLAESFDFSYWYDYLDRIDGNYVLQNQKNYDDQGRLKVDNMYKGGILNTHTVSEYYLDDRIKNQYEFEHHDGEVYLKLQTRYEGVETGVADSDNPYSGIRLSDYDSAGNLTAYEVDVYKEKSTELDYTNTYAKVLKGFDGYKEHHALVRSTHPLFRDGNVISGFNLHGDTINAVGSGGDEGTFSRLYYNSLEGHILFRGEQDKSQDYFYYKGNLVGSIGDTVEAKFDYNFQPVSQSYPASTPSGYTVNANDTLGSIAQAVYGDSTLWYLIADANALNQSKNDRGLAAGRRLTIPNIINNIHNDSDTFKPFNQSDVLGDLNPQLQFVPPPPPPGVDKTCQIIASIVVVIVVVVVSIYTAGVATSLMTPGLTLAGALAGGTVVVTPTLAAVVAGAAIGGAVGSIAGQLVGMGLGIQEEFSWKDVAIAGAASAVTAGLGEAVNSIGALGDLSKSSKFFHRAAIASTKATVSHAANYAVNELVGNKSTFNWASLAVSALAAPITGEVSRLGNAHLGNSILANTATNFVNGTINKVAQQVIAKNGKYQWVQVAANAFGNAIGNAIGEEIVRSSRERLNRKGGKGSSTPSGGGSSDVQHSGRPKQEPVSSLKPHGIEMDGPEINGYLPSTEEMLMPLAYGLVDSEGNVNQEFTDSLGSLFNDHQLGFNLQVLDGENEARRVILNNKDLYSRRGNQSGSNRFNQTQQSQMLPLDSGRNLGNIMRPEMLPLASDVSTLESEGIFWGIPAYGITEGYMADRAYEHGVNLVREVGGFLSWAADFAGLTSYEAMNRADDKLISTLGSIGSLLGSALLNHPGLRNMGYTYFPETTQLLPNVLDQAWNEYSTDISNAYRTGGVQKAGAYILVDTGVVLAETLLAPEEVALRYAAKVTTKATKLVSKLDVSRSKVPTSAAGSPAHKASRWQEYQERGGAWDYERWSKTYEVNMKQASKANAAMDSYHKKIGWGQREVTVDVNVDGVKTTRRLDIADPDLLKGIEHKTGYQTANKANLWEVKRDQILVDEYGWEIEWVFEGTSSKQLREALQKAGLKHNLE